MLVHVFEADWFSDPGSERSFVVVAVTDEVLDRSARSVARHPLRGYDALRLGTALVARDADPDLVELVSFDEALSAAARAEGFRVAP